MLLHSLRPGATAVVWPVASPAVFLVSTWVVPTVFHLELVEAFLGYLFREHLLVNLHNNHSMMHIPGMSKCRVRDPYG